MKMAFPSQSGKLSETPTVNRRADVLIIRRGSANASLTVKFFSPPDVEVFTHEKAFVLPTPETGSPRLHPLERPEEFTPENHVHPPDERR